MQSPSPAIEPSLSIEIPERVEISLDVAGLGTRALAYLIDALVLFLFWMTTAFVFSLIKTGGLALSELRALDSLVQAALVFGAFLIQWGYWVAFETAWAGQSPGKRALRIRVVKLDGSPVGFADAAARNLARVADFIPALYVVGLVTMVANPRSRRLGDLLAGTVVVRERRVDLGRYERAGDRVSATAALSVSELELISRFLERAPGLDPEARARLALKLAAPFAAHLSPEQRASVFADAAGAEAHLRALVEGHG